MLFGFEGLMIMGINVGIRENKDSWVFFIYKLGVLDLEDDLRINLKYIFVRFEVMYVSVIVMNFLIGCIIFFGDMMGLLEIGIFDCNWCLWLIVMWVWWDVVGVEEDWIWIILILIVRRIKEVYLVWESCLCNKRIEKNVVVRIFIWYVIWKVVMLRFDVVMYWRLFWMI